MQTFNTVRALTEQVNALRQKGRTIGFVPTMGALHQGHISLIERCVAENNACVASVFVNPTQFNDPKDLETYPRTPETDAHMLEQAGCDYLFMPSVEEMYPTPDTRQFSFGTLETVMEGASRPGHFNGVAQVVSRLFELVKPDKAYFGEKDFQQLAIIRAMVTQLGLPIDIVACPIVREADGLAMSSRNKRLTAEQREKAPLIADILLKSRTFASDNSVDATIGYISERLRPEDGFKLDYMAIVDGRTLQAVKDWAETDYIVGCVAVFCGPVRLIDNIVYKHVE
ncbi:MAG: Pantothenate synthetase [Bacteroidetes bacterium ADurb.Bin416]|jgi:pantoate--beta-alanine ligase|nr:MAG: Pantothenate synthetase [Bacteroidetes bacterium ADurb.Bin416]